ncbi:single-stranded DNA-binding protein [Variovorax sp. J22R24]|uniref:single-stranded DNA-binding protein n=1 Tax=Variovorax gracilis TaxID=3053502 RepID=UPI00257531EA|nr:single-stranded DNA-binding protein [Variovorax sp. J22R24]MDM0108447.1 single-stranded DNA-binding protein [Variovorax sp. J22R24]
MNRVQLIGRLGRDPEGGHSGKGSYATFSLATNEYWTDRGSGELVEHTEWHQLICYDRLAEIAREFLTKGSEVYVEGRQRTTHWTDKDGTEQRGLEIRIDEMKMLRRAPKTDPVVAAAKGMASIETLMKDVAVGLRNDVTLADLAGMLNVVRTNLAGDDSEKERSREPAAQGASA